MDDPFGEMEDEALLLAADQGESSGLSEAQKSRAEKNRLKAVALKKARLSAQPYPDPKQKSAADSKNDFITGESLKTSKAETKLIDTNAGFFIEESEDEPRAKPTMECLPAPVVEPERPTCKECEEEKFADSFLFRTFDLEVCDKCKDTEKDGKHELITKTDAKNEFLLKDEHFEREPTLKFLTRKNPHNQRWGDMKLFLRLQVEEKALEIWKNEESLEKEHEKRLEKRDQAKAKKFNKKLKALRMQVRGSLYKKDISEHVHDYGEEVYDEDEDQYSRTCSTCGHVHSYEKM